MVDNYANMLVYDMFQQLKKVPFRFIFLIIQKRHRYANILVYDMFEQ